MIRRSSISTTVNYCHAVHLYEGYSESKYRLQIFPLRLSFCACALTSLIYQQDSDAITRTVDHIYVLFCAFKMFRTIERPADF
jgi:hypothetical protein